MITQKELAALMADLESDRIERTESTSKTDKFEVDDRTFLATLLGRHA